MNNENTIVPYNKNTKDYFGADEAIHYIQSGQIEAYEIFAPKQTWNRPEFVSKFTFPEGGIDDFSGNENTDSIPYLNHRDLKKFLDAGIKFDHHVFTKNAIDIAPYEISISKQLMENGAKECVTKADQKRLEKLVKKNPDDNSYQQLLSIVNEELDSRPALEPHSLKDKILELREKFIGNKNTNSIKHKID